MAVQFALIVAGGLLEIAGVLLAAWDVRDSYRHWKAYEHRPQVVEPAPAVLHLQAFPPSVVVNPQPPVEERVAALEQQVATLQGDLAEAVRQQRRERDDRVGMTAAAITRMLQREDQALARLIREVVVGGRRRLVAVVFFLAGIAATTAGGLPIWT